MNNLIDRLDIIWSEFRHIGGYQRIMSKAGYSDKVLNLIDQWEEAELDNIVRATKYYNKETRLKVEDSIREFRLEINKDEIDDIRLDYLKPRIDKLQKIILEINKYNNHLKEVFYHPTKSYEWLRISIIDSLKIDKYKRELKRLIWDIRYIENKELIKKNEITEDMINRARNYPFENLVDIGVGGFIACPYHNENQASFYIKNNFGYCFGCGKSTDTIQYLIDTRGINFIEAVRKLQ